MFRLRAPEPDGADDLAHLGDVGCGQRFGVRPAPEELGRHLVHGSIGGLRREEHRDHELIGIAEPESALYLRIQLAHTPAHLDGPLPLGAFRLPRHCILPSSYVKDTTDGHIAMGVGTHIS